MRTRLVLVLVSLLLGGVPGFGRGSAVAESAIAGDGPSGGGDPVIAPAFVEKDIFGRHRVALDDYLGKVVLLNFWTTSCTPCREEARVLKFLQAAHAGQVVVIGVSVLSSSRDTERRYREYGLTYPVFYGSFELMEKYDKVAWIPTTFIIDRNGTIVAEVHGSRTREQYEAMLRPLLYP